MKFNKSFKFRLYPTKKQIEYIEGCFNACRYVYNVSLDCENQLYDLCAKSNVNHIALSYHLPIYKIKDTWLKKYDSLALVFEMENLANAYKKFFDNLKKNKKGGFPKFKSKYDTKQSFRTYQNIQIFEDSINIPKLKNIKAVIHRPIEGKLKQFTILRENDKYYVSAMCEIEKDLIPVEIKKEVGIDMGVKTFITKYDSDNKYEKIDNPKFFKEEAEYLKILQQKLSRSKKDSSNYKKLKNKISNLHEKIKNKRDNFLHNVSTSLVNEYDCIYIEDLNINGMTKSPKGTIEKPGKNIKQKSGLNRNILDTSLGKFKTFLEYKTKFSGKGLHKVDRFFASSKICNCCGTKNSNLKLCDRKWICEKCGEELDRDENASNNIFNEGRIVRLKK